MKFCANPQTAVIALQTVSAIAMMVTRLPLSASRATGSPSVA
jgi:hypothetical protein